MGLGAKTGGEDRSWGRYQLPCESCTMAEVLALFREGWATFASPEVLGLKQLQSHHPQGDVSIPCIRTLGLWYLYNPPSVAKHWNISESLVLSRLGLQPAIQLCLLLYYRWQGLLYRLLPINKGLWPLHWAINCLLTSSSLSLTFYSIWTQLSIN